MLDLIAQTFAMIKLNLKGILHDIEKIKFVVGSSLFITYSGKLSLASFSLQTINDKEFVSVLNSLTLYTLPRNCQRIKGP